MLITEFLHEMNLFVPKQARMMLCQFRGDPHADSRGKWKAKPLSQIQQLDPVANIYLTVSAMKQNERGEYRRRKENFAGGLLLMIDDLGSGVGAKFPMSTIDPLPPTALVETSPGNFQAIYMFDRLVTDRVKFENLIKGFIEKQFLGSDTGMAGVNRVFRPPYGINGKEKYLRDGKPWQVRMEEWVPMRRYSPEKIAEAFGINLNRPSRQIPRGATIDKAASIRDFVNVRTALRSAGMVKADVENMEGWLDIKCPWTAHHTGSVDNGASIRIPDADNGFVGAFKCHHGGCEEKHWSDLTTWLSEQQAEVLDAINKNANELEFYL